MTSNITDQLRQLCITHVEGNGVELQRVNRVLKPTTAIWAKFAYLPGESVTKQYGRVKTARRPGVLLISLHVPINTGDGIIKEKAELIINAFSFLRSGVLRFDSAYEQPPVEDGEWFMVNVACPFDADTQHGS